SSAHFTRAGLVVTSGYDGAIKIWDAQTGRELGSFEGHTNWAAWVDVSPTGDRLVSSDLAGAVIAWDLPRDARPAAARVAALEPRLPFLVQDGVLVPRPLH